ncbi:MAG: hypothetical protein ACE5E6_02740 [Phycisphaerae bacterium]
MRSRFRRTVGVAALLGAGGFLMASPNTACLGFALENLTTSVDFCFIFDCQSGVLGGTIQPCDIGFNDNPNQVSGSLFQDCPALDAPLDDFPLGP